MRAGACRFKIIGSLRTEYYSMNPKCERKVLGFSYINQSEICVKSLSDVQRLLVVNVLNKS